MRREKMNNSYNYSSFVGFSSATNDEMKVHEPETQLQQLTDTSANQRDETVDSILFCCALADIYYTD